MNQEILQHIFDYHEGSLIWKNPTGPRALKGTVAGSIDTYGYRQVSVFGRKHLAHKLVWIWHGKELVEGLEFDHINRVRADNRIENLRLITHLENIQISTLKESLKTRPRVNGRWTKGNT